MLCIYILMTLKFISYLILCPEIQTFVFNYQPNISARVFNKHLTKVLLALLFFHHSCNPLGFSISGKWQVHPHFGQGQILTVTYNSSMSPKSKMTTPSSWLGLPSFSTESPRSLQSQENQMVVHVTHILHLALLCSRALIF